MSEQLKSCPFCGEELPVLKSFLSTKSSISGYYYQCKKCHYKSGLAESKSEAALVWNVNKIKEYKEDKKNEDKIMA